MTESVAPPQRILRFFDKVLVLFMLGCMAVVSFVVIRREAYLFGLHNVLILVAIPIAIVVVGLWSFRWKAERRASYVLLLMAGLVVLYGIETFLTLDGPEKVNQLLHPKPAGFDERTELEVVTDLRGDGEEIYPQVAPADLVAPPLQVDGVETQPLAGVPLMTVVHCNESGEYSIYESDRYGFNNPDEIWDSESIDLVTIGDSFTQGACVSREDTIAAGLREAVPGTLNLGFGGNGSIVEYATLREFGAPFKPKDVVWFFYLNDLHDLAWEQQSEILMNYLEDPDFSQDLRDRSVEIGQALRDWVDEKMANPPTRSLTATIKQIISLGAIRSELDLIPGPHAETKAPVRVDLLESALRAAQSDVTSWGGRLHVVYLPSFYALEAGEPDAEREVIERVTDELDLPLLDIFEVMMKHPDPLSLFPYRSYGHYTPAGYDLVSNAVLEDLELSSLSSDR